MKKYRVAFSELTGFGVGILLITASSWFIVGLVVGLVIST